MRFIAILALCLSGCMEAAAIVNPVSDLPDFDKLLQQADDASYQPKLENDFRKDGTEPPPAKEVVSKIEVTVYGPPACGPCERAVKDGNESKRFHFVKQEKIPQSIIDYANTWNQGKFPVVTFLDRNGAERCVAPWRGLTEFEKRYDRTVKPKAQDVPAAAGVLATTQSIWSTGNWWTPEQLRSHLREHGYTAARISQMNDAQCAAAHESEHAGILSWAARHQRRRNRRAA